MYQVFNNITAYAMNEVKIVSNIIQIVNNYRIVNTKYTNFRVLNLIITFSNKIKRSNFTYLTTSKTESTSSAPSV